MSGTRTPRSKRTAAWYKHVHELARELVYACREHEIPIIVLATVSDDGSIVDALGNTPKGDKNGPVHDSLVTAVESGFFGTCELNQEVFSV